MQTVHAVERVANVEEFARASRALSVPVVVSEALSDWPAFREWDMPSIAERLAGKSFFFKKSNNNAHPNFRAQELAQMFARESLSFAEFFERISRGPVAERSRWLFTGDEHFLYRVRDGQAQLNPDLAPLWPDVRVPAMIPADRLYSVWAWFSGPGVRTWLHYDNNGCHNLNAQLRGRKTAWLFPPAELPKLHLFPKGGANPALNCSQIDVDQPDLLRFPEFAQATAWEVNVERGDLLFIPANWPHAFFHHGEFNANVNFWWKPETAIVDPVSLREVELKR